MDGRQDQVFRQTRPPGALHQGRADQEIVLAQSRLPALQIRVARESRAVQTDHQRILLRRTVRGRHEEPIPVVMVTDANRQPRLYPDRLHPVGTPFLDHHAHGVEISAGVSENVGEEEARTVWILRPKILIDKVREGPGTGFRRARVRRERAGQRQQQSSQGHADKEADRTQPRWRSNAAGGDEPERGWAQDTSVQQRESHCETVTPLPRACQKVRPKAVQARRDERPRTDRTCSG